MGAEAAAIAAMIANAVKASGTVIRIEPDEFVKILKKVDAPLVIYAEGGMISTNYQYMVSYKGFAFYCKADDPIELPKKAEVVVADKIWIPG
jgi:GGDEF domain-containing protein